VINHEVNDDDLLSGSWGAVCGLLLSLAVGAAVAAAALARLAGWALS